MDIQKKDSKQSFTNATMNPERNFRGEELVTLCKLPFSPAACIFRSMGNREKQRDIPEKVRDLVDKIAADYKPEKIVLFGSYAWGEPHEWSDVDLLIIKDTDTKRTRRREEALAGLHDRLLPIDVIIITPEELKWVLKKKISFIGKVLEEGAVVYEQ